MSFFLREIRGFEALCDYLLMSGRVQTRSRCVEDHSRVRHGADEVGYAGREDSPMDWEPDGYDRLCGPAAPEYNADEKDQ